MKVLVRTVLRIAIIALIVTSFTSFLNMLNIFPAYFCSYCDEETGYLWVAYVLVLTTWLIFIALLILAWKKTDWLVKVLAGPNATEELPFQMQSREIYSLALKFLGVWVLVNAIPDFVRFLSIYINLSGGTGGYDIGIPQETLPNLIGAGVKILIGIWLVLGLQGISNMLDKLMNLPVNKDVE